MVWAVDHNVSCVWSNNKLMSYGVGIFVVVKCSAQIGISDPNQLHGARHFAISMYGASKPWFINPPCSTIVIAVALITRQFASNEFANGWP